MNIITTYLNVFFIKILTILKYIKIYLKLSYYYITHARETPYTVYFLFDLTQPNLVIDSSL